MSELNEKRVFIVGLGQIGGSIGLDLVGAGAAGEVIGYDINPISMETALARKAVHRCADSIEEGVKVADLVIICSPIQVAIQMAPLICHLAGHDKTVMDVASTKHELLKAAIDANGVDNFVGGHPLAGTEKIGIDGAQAGMFNGKSFVLTPGVNTLETHLPAARGLVHGLRAIPVLMSARDHDRAIALTSNLPHLLALSLANLAAGRFEEDSRTASLTGGSFRSVIRVAASSPRLILDMLLTNRDEIIPAIDEMIDELSTMKGLITGRDEESLQSVISKAKQIADESKYG